ncbi:protein of unknown function (plasmid) [Caballeronia sp. S22]
MKHSRYQGRSIRARETTLALQRSSEPTAGWSPLSLWGSFGLHQYELGAGCFSETSTTSPK